MSRIGYLGVFLMLVCLVSAAALALTHQVTNPRILAHREQVRQEGMTRVLPDADEFADAPGWVDELLAEDDFARVREVNVGVAEGQEIGFVFTVAPYGYAEEIVTMVGISAGRITGVQVLEQAETPGLGARVQEAEFQQQFSDLPTDETVAVVQDGGEIDSLTGATESSRAVARGVDTARLLYERIRKER